MLNAACAVPEHAPSSAQGPRLPLPEYELGRRPSCGDHPFRDPKTGEYTHPEQHRTLIIREAARLQGLLDAFVLHGDRSAQFEQAGNVVQSSWLALSPQKSAAAWPVILGSGSSNRSAAAQCLRSVRMVSCPKRCRRRLHERCHPVIAASATYGGRA